METILHDLIKMYSIKIPNDPLLKLGREIPTTAKFSYIEKELEISK